MGSIAGFQSIFLWNFMLFTDSVLQSDLEGKIMRMDIITDVKQSLTYISTLWMIKLKTNELREKQNSEKLPFIHLAFI